MPTSGNGILVDADAVNSADLYTVFNGPEWVNTADSDQIVYTKFLPKRKHLLINARLAVARQDAGGIWAPAFLGPDVPRNAP